MYQRKRDSYQGFSKYVDEINHGNQVREIEGGQRSQSLLNGAGMAAAAALRMHQQERQPEARLAPVQAARRANSLRGPSRTNSLRTYVYNPKPSYTVGQPADLHLTRRHSSLTNRYSSGLAYSHTNVKPKPAPRDVYSSDVTSDYDENYDGDVTITTKTTKVKDPLGRTQSITVETIKTFPDGSTVTNTTSKNISRGGSRVNSLRNNSMLSNGANGYSLTKIDEDLHDFEYNYELDHQNNLHSVPDSIGLDHNRNNLLRLNHNQYEPPSTDALRKDDLQYHSDTSSNTNGIGGMHGSDSNKPLRSILKKKNTVKPEENTTAHAVTPDDPVESPRHPYAMFSGKNSNEGTSENLSPIMDQNKTFTPLKSPESTYRKPTSIASPQSRYEDIASSHSMNSVPNSIKFKDRVETIPYDEPETPNKEENDRLLYEKALQVANERVYGNKDAANISDNASKSLNRKRSQKQRKVEKIENLGLSGEYKYENHHKGFVGLSLRDNQANHNLSSGESRNSREPKESKEKGKLMKIMTKDKNKVLEKEKKHAEKEKLKKLEKERKTAEKERAKILEKEKKNEEKERKNLEKEKKKGLKSPKDHLLPSFQYILKKKSNKDSSHLSSEGEVAVGGTLSENSTIVSDNVSGAAKSLSENETPKNIHTPSENIATSVSNGFSGAEQAPKLSLKASDKVAAHEIDSAREEEKHTLDPFAKRDQNQLKNDSRDIIGLHSATDLGTASIKQEEGTVSTNGIPDAIVVESNKDHEDTHKTEGPIFGSIDEPKNKQNNDIHHITVPQLNEVKSDSELDPEEDMDEVFVDPEDIQEDASTKLPDPQINSPSLKQEKTSTLVDSEPEQKTEEVLDRSPEIKPENVTSIDIPNENSDTFLTTNGEDQAVSTHSHENVPDVTSAGSKVTGLENHVLQHQDSKENEINGPVINTTPPPSGNAESGKPANDAISSLLYDDSKPIANNDSDLDKHSGLKAKKGKKFREKLFKYFVNTYDK